MKNIIITILLLPLFMNIASAIGNGDPCHGDDPCNGDPACEETRSYDCMVAQDEEKQNSEPDRAVVEKYYDDKNQNEAIKVGTICIVSIIIIWFGITVWDEKHKKR